VVQFPEGKTVVAMASYAPGKVLLPALKCSHSLLMLLRTCAVWRFRYGVSAWLTCMVYWRGSAWVSMHAQVERTLTINWKTWELIIKQEDLVDGALSTSRTIQIPPDWCGHTALLSPLINSPPSCSRTSLAGWHW
jgi:hypothetical protein